MYDLSIAIQLYERDASRLYQVLVQYESRVSVCDRVEISYESRVYSKFTHCRDSVCRSLLAYELVCALARLLRSVKVHVDNDVGSTMCTSS